MQIKPGLAPQSFGTNWFFQALQCRSNRFRPRNMYPSSSSPAIRIKPVPALQYAWIQLVPALRCRFNWFRPTMRFQPVQDPQWGYNRFRPSNTDPTGSSPTIWIQPVLAQQWGFNRLRPHNADSAGSGTAMQIQPVPAPQCGLNPFRSHNAD